MILCKNQSTDDTWGSQDFKVIMELIIFISKCAQHKNCIFYFADWCIQKL